MGGGRDGRGPGVMSVFRDKCSWFEDPEKGDSGCSGDGTATRFERFRTVSMSMSWVYSSLCDHHGTRNSAGPFKNLVVEEIRPEDRIVYEVMES